MRGSTNAASPTALTGFFDIAATAFVPPLEPPAFSTQIVHVNFGGSDATGEGTAGRPFATVAYALTTITDAAYTKRYVICGRTGRLCGRH